MKITKGRSGFTLVEPIVAIIIVLIIATVGLASHMWILNRIHNQYSALNLACAQIEELKARLKAEIIDYSTHPDLVDGDHNYTTLPAEVPPGFILTYRVDDKFDWGEDGIPPADIEPEYKIITATCVDGSGNQVQLNAYITE